MNTPGIEGSVLRITAEVLRKGRGVVALGVFPCEEERHLLP